MTNQAKPLPKSLHTITAIVCVARKLRVIGGHTTDEGGYSSAAYGRRSSELTGGRVSIRPEDQFRGAQ